MSVHFLCRRPVEPEPQPVEVEVGDSAVARRSARRGKSGDKELGDKDTGDSSLAMRRARRGKSGGRHRPKTAGRYGKVLVVGGWRRDGEKGREPGAGRAKTTGGSRKLAVGDCGWRGVSEMPTVQE